MEYFRHPIIRALLWLLVATIILVTCTGCAVNGEWRTRDTVLELAFQAVNAADAYSTANIQHVPDIDLGNGFVLRRVEGSALTRAIIGERPNDRDTYTYFATMALSHWLISRALPPRWRPWFQVGTTLYSGYAVKGNCDKDLC